MYVALRYAHAGVHCTTNKVMHRFSAFAAGCFVLALIWARVAYDLVAGEVPLTCSRRS